MVCLGHAKHPLRRIVGFDNLFLKSGRYNLITLGHHEDCRDLGPGRVANAIQMLRDLTGEGTGKPFGVLPHGLPFDHLAQSRRILQ